MANDIEVGAKNVSDKDVADPKDLISHVPGAAPKSTSEALTQEQIEATKALLDSSAAIFAVNRVVNILSQYTYSQNRLIRYLGYTAQATTCLVAASFFVTSSVVAYIAVNAAHYITRGYVGYRAFEITSAIAMQNATTAQLVEFVSKYQIYGLLARLDMSALLKASAIILPKKLKLDEEKTAHFNELLAKVADIVDINGLRVVETLQNKVSAIGIDKLKLLIDEALKKPKDKVALVKAAMPFIGMLKEPALVDAVKRLLGNENVRGILGIVLGEDSALYNLIEWIYGNIDYITKLAAQVPDIKGLEDVLVKVASKEPRDVNFAKDLAEKVLQDGGAVEALATFLESEGAFQTISQSLSVTLINTSIAESMVLVGDVYSLFEKLEDGEFQNKLNQIFTLKEFTNADEKTQAKIVGIIAKILPADDKKAELKKLLNKDPVFLSWVIKSLTEEERNPILEKVELLKKELAQFGSSVSQQLVSDIPKILRFVKAIGIDKLKLLIDEALKKPKDKVALVKAAMPFIWMLKEPALVDAVKRLLGNENVQNIIAILVGRDQGIEEICGIVSNVLTIDNAHTLAESGAHLVLLRDEFKNKLQELEQENMSLEATSVELPIIKDSEAKHREKIEILEKELQNLAQQFDTELIGAIKVYKSIIDSLGVNGKVEDKERAQEVIKKLVIEQKLLPESLSFISEDMILDLALNKSADVVRVALMKFVFKEVAPYLSFKSDYLKSLQAITTEAPSLISAAFSSRVYESGYSLAQILRDVTKTNTAKDLGSLTEALAKIPSSDQIFSTQVYHSLVFKDLELSSHLNISLSKIGMLIFDDAVIALLDIHDSSIAQLQLKDSIFVQCNFNNCSFENVEISNAKFVDLESFESLIRSVYNGKVQSISIRSISFNDPNSIDYKKLREILSILPDIDAFIADNQAFATVYTKEAVVNDIVGGLNNRMPNYDNIGEALLKKIDSYSVQKLQFLSKPEVKAELIQRITLVMQEAKASPTYTIENVLESEVETILQQIDAMNFTTQKSDYISSTFATPILSALSSFGVKSQKLEDILKIARSRFVESKDHEKVDLADLIFVDSNKTEFGVTSFWKSLSLTPTTYDTLNFEGCKINKLHDETQLMLPNISVKVLQFKDADVSGINLNNSNIEYLIMKNSTVTDLDLQNLNSVSNIEVENVTMDKRTFVGLMNVISRCDVKMLSLKNIKPTEDLVEYLKNPVNAREVRAQLAYLPNFGEFLINNAELSEHINNIYTKDSVFKVLYSGVVSMNSTLSNERKNIVMQQLKDSLQNLDIEQLRTLVKNKAKVVEGLAEVMKSDKYINHLRDGDSVNSDLIKDSVKSIIEGNSRTLSYSSSREQIARNIVADIEKYQSDLYNVNIDAITKALTTAVNCVDDRYISLLNKQQNGLLGEQKYSWFGGYQYYTGVLGVAYDSGDKEHHNMVDQVKKIMKEMLGSEHIFDTQREIDELSKA